MQITGVTGNNNCNYITLSAKSDVGSHVHCDAGYVIIVIKFWLNSKTIVL